MPAPWPDIELSDDPRLVVGYRKSSGLIDCYRIDIHEDTFTEFEEIAQAARERMGSMTRRPYAHFGALEEDEYFALDIATIPTRPVRRRGRKSDAGADGQEPPPTQEATPGGEEVAAALKMVAETDDHPVLASDDLRSGLKLNLYMISFPVASGFVGFIRRTGPRRAIAPGLRFFQYGDTLKRVTEPDFVFDDRVDVIVGPDEVAIFSDSAVQVLFRDVQLVMESVPENVTSISSVFQVDLPITPEGINALSRVCARGPRAAKRLDDLVHLRLGDLPLEAGPIAESLTKHGLDSLLVAGSLDLSEDSIPAFLDFLEGRLYHDDHTREPRRADRFSNR